MLSDVTSDIDPFGVQGTTTYHYVIVRKYSSSGSVLATKNISIQNHISAGFNNYSAGSIKIDVAGNVYIGYSSYNANTDFDVVLAKLDNNLARVWENFYQNTGTDNLIDMKLNTFGTLYAVIKTVVGPSISYSVIASVPSNSSSQLIVPFAPNVISISSLALDNSQAIYVGGYIVKAGSKNAYVAAIDLTHNFITWSSSYSPKGVQGDDYVNEITVGSDGNIYAVGTSFQGNLGDLVLVLKNTPGNPRFDFIVTLKGAGPMKGIFINASESGWLYIGAVAYNDFIAYAYRIPSDGIFVTPGMIEFVPTPVANYNALTDITLSDMKVSSGKNIYLTGSVMADGPSGTFSCSYLFKSSVVFGNALIDAGGMPVEGDFNGNLEGVNVSLDYSKADVYQLRNFWDDAHLVEKIELIDINVPSPLRYSSTNCDEKISLSPNPAREQLKINSAASIMQVEILNMEGALLMNETGNSKTVLLNTASLSPGIYLCKVLTENGEAIQKLVIN